MKEDMENEVVSVDEEMVRNPGFQTDKADLFYLQRRVFAFTATPSDEALKFVKSHLKSLVQLWVDDADNH
jgi:hypothetical protein